MADDLRHAVGQNVYAMRKAQGLTQMRFGFRYGYNRSWVGLVENARLNLTMDSIQQLADRLNVDVFVLVGRPAESAPPTPASKAESRDDEAGRQSG